MEALQLSPQEWYNLREHIDDLTTEYVRFKFPEANAPEMNSGVFEHLKKHFQSITIDRPLEPLPLHYNSVAQEYRSCGWLYITLHFTDQQSKMISDDFIKKLTNTMNP